MCPALVSRPGLPAVSESNDRMLHQRTIRSIFVLGVSLPAQLAAGWALRASCTRQHEDLLALLHLSKKPSLRWNCCGTHSASAESQTPAFARGTVSTTMALHGSQCRALMLQNHQPRSACHQCRHTSDIPELDFQWCRKIQGSARNSGVRATRSSWELALTVRSWVSTPCRKPTVCRTTCEFCKDTPIPQLSKQLDCRRSFRVFAVRVISAFPMNSSEVCTASDSAAVVSDSSLASSLWITWWKLMTLMCSLSSEMRRDFDSSTWAKLILCATAFAPADSASVQSDAALEHMSLIRAYMHCNSILNVVLSKPIHLCCRILFTGSWSKVLIACPITSARISRVSAIVWVSTSCSAGLTSHVASVALRFARDASCSPKDSWVLANLAVLRSLESFVSCASRLFSLCCCWLLAAISSFFASLN